MLNRKMKPIAIAVGAAFAASIGASAAAEGQADPFEAGLLEEGILVATSHKEGGCGEDRKSEGEEEAKCGEGEKGDDSEGKCGEGKCGEEGEGDEGEAEESDEE